MNILYVTDESVIGGVVRSGVAEVVDSLANAVAEDTAHTVSVICPDGNSTFVRMAFGVRQESGYRKCKLLGVHYYLLPRGADFTARAAALADKLSPEVLHNFAEPELLTMMECRPARAVYTIDRAEFVRDKVEALAAYDAVTTVSRAYAEELLGAGDALAETLRGMEFRGITNGILTTVLNPANGLFLDTSYKPEDLSGKEACKRHLLEMYGIKGEPCIYLYMGRLAAEKGMDDMLDAVETIRASGGFTIFVGLGEERYEKALSALNRSDGALWVERWASPTQMLPMLSGADFYLSPSVSEPCGLMPMTAARYGVVPVTTLSGGLADNMDGEIAVLIGEDGLSGAVARASALYADGEAMDAKRRACMERDFSWDTRKAEYIKLYGGQDHE